jgi:hypothetical protein
LIGGLAVLFPASAHDIPGINRPQIAWLRPDTQWQRRIDDMANSGVTSLRMMLVTPFARTVDVIRYCNERGIAVLIMIPLSLDIYFDKDVARRPGNSALYTVPPLSRLNTALFQKEWDEFLDLLISRKGRIEAIQIDNEFNSAVFNGDLPIIKGGAIVSTSNYSNYPFWADYVRGMRNLTTVVRIARLSVLSRKLDSKVTVVLGGLARPTDSWIRNVNSTLVEPELALKTLLELGVDTHVDAYAIHLYPPVLNRPGANSVEVIRNYLHERFSNLVPLVPAKKKWWITEWGFPVPDKTPQCSPKDPRAELFKSFPSILAGSEWGAVVGPTFIYDWDESNRFRIWDGKTVLCGTNLFRS